MCVSQSFAVLPLGGQNRETSETRDPLRSDLFFWGETSRETTEDSLFLQGQQSPTLSSRIKRLLIRSDRG